MGSTLNIALFQQHSDFQRQHVNAAAVKAGKPRDETLRQVHTNKQTTYVLVFGTLQGIISQNVVDL